METIATYRNDADGLEVLIMDGNDKFNYRVAFRDSNADKTIFVRFKHSYFACMEDIKEFLLNDYIHVETA